MADFYRCDNLVRGYADKGSTAVINIFTSESILKLVDDPQNDQNWLKIRQYQFGVFGPETWIENQDVTLLEQYTPVFHYDEKDYTTTCVWDTWNFNEGETAKPFYANPDFLLALSQIQSNFNHNAERGPNNERKGILGITEEEWKIFRTTAYGSGYQSIDLFNPYAQVSIAIWHTHEDAKALAKLWHQDQNIGTQDDPYQPRFGELLRCRLLDVQRTFEIQKHLKNGEGTINLRDFLRESMSHDETEALLTDRRRFMRLGGTNDGDPFTLKMFHDKCAEILNAQFITAFSMIKNHVPESIPSTSGDAPWMPLALQELAAGINEGDANGRQRIAEYFDSTGFSQGTADDKWCAAFVAWCMDQSGGQVRESYQHIKNKAAAAASWRSWGNSIVNIKDDPPEGAVVVKAPSSGTDAISHVGFFRSYSDGKRRIYLLGGNQSDAVTEQDYKAEEVVDIRWLDVDTAGSSPEPIYGALLDLISEPESDGNYNAYSGNTQNEDNPDLTAMTVAAVRSWQNDWRTRSESISSAVGRYQIIASTMDGLIAKIPEASNAAALFDEPMQDKMALVLIGKQRLDKLAAQKDTYVIEFGNALARIWAGLPVLSATTYKGRPVSRGESYYKYVGQNAAGISGNEFEERLRNIVGNL